MKLRRGLTEFADGILAGMAPLGLNNVGQAASRLDDDEKSNIITNDVAIGGRPPLIINESGLYSLILTSRKPEAKRFKRWITHEVLPAIRKTGRYEMGSEAVDPIIALYRAGEQTRLKQIEQDGEERRNRVVAMVSAVDADHRAEKAKRLLRPNLTGTLLEGILLERFHRVVGPGYSP